MLISVIIPYRNRISTLPRCLSSILRQKHRPIELILVNNASSDNSESVCHDFASQNPSDGITYIFMSETTAGASAARNMGLQRASADYISFFDSDDEMGEDFLYDMRKAIECTDADLYIGRTLMIMPNRKENTRKGYYCTSVADQILMGFINTQSFVTKKSLIESVGGWNESLTIWLDWELGVRLLLSAPRICWLSCGPYHRIYRHPNSITGEGFSHSADAIIDSLSAVSDTLHSPSFGHSTERDFWCLTSREAILSGHLLREGTVFKSRELMEMAKKESGGNLLKSIFLKIIRRYVAWGGRGAWLLARIASKFVW